MNRLKKPISLILSIVLILSTLIVGGVSSLAAESPTIYSDVISATAGNTVEIPIYIKDNSGLLGWNLIFKYDSNILKPKSISKGMGWNGILSDTISDSIYVKDGEFEAKYQQGTLNNNTSNGIIMYATFEVDKTAVGSTDIFVSFNQENTYDCDYEDVILNPENIKVNISNSSTVIAFDSKEITAGEYVDLPLSIINSNSLSAIDITLDYDNENFEYIDFESGNSLDVKILESNGKIKISISGILSDIDNAIILKFKSSDFAYAKQYEFKTVKDNAVGSDNVIIRNSHINVKASETSDSVVISSDVDLKVDYGEIISIPFYMSHNKGLFSYGLILGYDSTCLKPVSIEIAYGFGGQIIDNIGRYNDHINIMWNNVEDTDKNGEFIIAKFQVLSKQEDINTSIKVDYSQDDTSNFAGGNVTFICNDVNIILNHIPVVTELTLKSKPSKLTYELFEDFDASGMVIEATKDDGSIETVTDYTVTGFETNSVGTKTVTISYEGKSVSFDIEVAHTHTWGEWETVSSPNCLDKGSEKRVCSVCKEIEMRDVDPLGHNWEKDFTVDIEPKCETASSKSIHCSRCDVVKDITPIDPIGHDYESSITKAATCTENGIKTFVCKNDPSHTHTEEIPKLGHNYVASITKQPTCEEKGIKTFVCSHDSSHTYTEDIPAIGHSFELTKTIKPTCTEDGKEVYTCKNDSSHTKEVVLKATGHTPSDWIIDKKPTYLEDGSRHKECTICKTVLTTETISMLDDITAPEIEIKVKDNSFKSFINNISFGLFFKDTVDVNITAQDAESGIEKVEYIKTNAPISESDIALQTEWISGEKLTVSDDEEFIIYVKATDKQGNISYAGTDGMVVDKTAPVINGITNNAIYCQSVSFSVSDKYIEKVIVNGTEALTDSGEYTLSSADSQYKIVAVDKAGNETVYNVTVNDGHTYGDWVTDESADCTNNGEKHRVCSICGNVENVVIPALGHNYLDEFIVDKAATCTENGEKSRHCSRCDSRKDVTVISATGHSFGEWKTVVSPDCTNLGSRQRVCTVCGFTETENLNPNGHKWNSDYTIGIPATCTTNGSKSIHCADCDAVKDSQIIPATGHNLGEYKVIEPSTCTENGLEKRTCANCDYSETREIPVLGHDYAEEFTVDKAPTCTENGEKSRHCLRCDSKADITVVPATGHSYGEWSVITAPTCTEKGTQQRVCSICGNAEVKEISSTGHIWNDDYTVDKKPTCTTEGSKSIHCVNCDAIKDSVIIPAVGHSGGTANCHSGAICDVCGKEYGEPDLSNHDGEIEIRGYIAPTVDDFGYTGDTYCKSCGTKLADGERIDKLPPETTEPTKPSDTTENPTDKEESTTQKSETTNNSDSVDKNTSKKSPATGSTIALPIAVSTAFVISLICVVKRKKKED